MNGSTVDLPDPKTQATQKLLGDVYDVLDEASDLIEAAWQASCGPNFNHEDSNPIRAVLTVAKNKVTEAQKRLHDTISWCPVGVPSA